MSHAENKVNWCLRKAESEMNESGIHRGLVKINSDGKRAGEHMLKAEHYLSATEYLKNGNFTDISASTVFYSMYHCLLAICIKFGYESRNQECTFALMSKLIEDNKIDFKEELLNKIASLDTSVEDGQTSSEIREKYQYGTNVSLTENMYNFLFDLAREVISKTKDIIEKD